MGRRQQKKSQLIQFIEYAAVFAFIQVVQRLPLDILHGIGGLLGNVGYYLMPRRRRIALQNLRMALSGAKDDRELRGLARRSCQSFLATVLEIIKFHFLPADLNAPHIQKHRPTDLESLFRKAKDIHTASGGCIFVTPHLGNWELLPYAAALVGIPLAVVVRPLDNAHLEKLIYANRTATGQMIIPKKNAFFVLGGVLRQGKSIGILPDQSQKKGIAVAFFGHRALTTPVPALLAIMYQRPIVVVACCRKPGEERFEGFVSDPIWPVDYTSEKAEIYRLTEEMNRHMESIIRRHPEQYFWMHNRWKTYRTKKEFLA
jgi:Kdo2-lipid IVA lauroyltransferase/acyltransferase